MGRLSKDLATGLGLALCLMAPYPALAQIPPEDETPVLASDPELDAILSADIADLTVTTVSRRAQKLTETAAAIYVITNEDIRRMGATNIPEALRMVPGLDVAQAGANRWAVSSRGFNGVLASKLLVLIDGRTVYTPVFSGTYWDDRTVPLVDLDRIEVIRGPGASLYGANAVNGIINIITKSAAETQGNVVKAGIGTEENRVTARHGGKLGEDSYYRGYVQMADYDSTYRNPGAQNVDDWNQGRTGFRIDADQKQSDSYTLQGDAYRGRFDSEQLLFQPTAPYSALIQDRDTSLGGNILGRWNRKVNDHSQISLQGYIDHYSRNEINFEQYVTTADIQFQHTLQLGSRHNFIWGAGNRYIIEDLSDTFNSGIMDDNVARNVASLFLQDEYAVITDELFLTLGSKLEHNSFTGIEIQPSARISWQPNARQTVWGAVSRAVRTPSEIENQAIATVAVVPGAPPTGYALTGSPSQDSEELTAYELGYRLQVQRNISVDSTVFYNEYEKLAAFSPIGATPFLYKGIPYFPVPFNNLGQGETYGFEMAANWNVTPRWKLSGSYTLLHMDLDKDPGAIALLYVAKDSSQQQVALRSYYDINDRLQWDNMLYYVDEASTAPAYLRYDTRLGWQAAPGLDISLVGRNLLDDSHPEFAYFPQAEIERSVLAIATWRF